MLGFGSFWLVMLAGSSAVEKTSLIEFVLSVVVLKLKVKCDDGMLVVLVVVVGGGGGGGGIG